MYVLNGDGSKILDALIRMGFKEYEAKAYFTMLLCGEAKAGVIARLSGVPQSKIYCVLEALTDKGVVSEKGGRPRWYETAPLADVVASYVKLAESDIAHARESKRWLNRIVKTFSPLLRDDTRARVFEPVYRRG